MGRLRNETIKKNHLENSKSEHILFTPFSSFVSIGGNLYEAKSVEKSILNKSRLD